MTDATSLINIKGLRDGLLITMGNAPWDELRTALLEQIEARQSFFHGARLALDVGEQIFHVNDLSALRDTLSEKGINLWAVVSESPTTEQTSQLLGLATRISKPRPEEIQRSLGEEANDQTSLWVGRTLRSGTRVAFAGHVAVMGDVNPGAEVVADGSILIWGRVRGAIHAGASGDETSVICALEFLSSQVRIADETISTVGLVGTGQPEKISLLDGRAQIETWQADDIKVKP